MQIATNQSQTRKLFKYMTPDIIFVQLISSEKQ